MLSAGVKDPDVFTLFFPSSLLSALDPLKEGLPGTLEVAQSRMREQLKSNLHDSTIKVTKRLGRRILPPHILLIALTPAGEWARARATWKDAVHRFSGSHRVTPETVERTIASWERRIPREGITRVHPNELERLVDLALKSPAVVLGRALSRHWSQTFSDELIKSKTWSGIRSERYRAGRGKAATLELLSLSVTTAIG
ncbi:hypothetical protein B0G80_5910 [Paraburkholderia sp. BL6669N2]|nr:hypothetical protein B0G80_5910 [Paraburkholderia sp. BL6669N2]